MREGASTVRQAVEDRKAKAPRGKVARKQTRDARGQYKRAQVVPNQPGSFAAKARHRLVAERQGR